MKLLQTFYKQVGWADIYWVGDGLVALRINQELLLQRFERARDLYGGALDDGRAY